MRSAHRCRSRWTAGSAFSWITKDALVCWRKTVHSPVRTPARATARRISPVTSCSPRPRAGRSISSWWTFTDPTLHPRAHLSVRGGPLRLAQRLNEGLAELLQVVGLAAGDPVLVDDHRLVLHVRAGQLEIHLHGRPGGQGPAAHQPRAEEELGPVADRRQGPLERVEALDELDEARVDAQVVRRVPAGDEQAEVVLGSDLVDALVGLDLFLPPVPLELHAGLRPDDVDLVSFFAHPVVGNAELRVLESIAQQAGDFPSCHGFLLVRATDAHRIRPVRGRPESGRAGFTARLASGKLYPWPASSR